MHINHFPTNLSPPVTSKMGSRSPNLISSFTCPSIIDVQVWSKSIHSYKKEIGCGQALFQQSKPFCDLENGVKVTKSNQFF